VVPVRVETAVHYVLQIWRDVGGLVNINPPVDFGLVDGGRIEGQVTGIAAPGHGHAERRVLDGHGVGQREEIRNRLGTIIGDAGAEVPASGSGRATGQYVGAIVVHVGAGGAAQLGVVTAVVPETGLCHVAACVPAQFPGTEYALAVFAHVDHVSVRRVR